MASNSGYFFIHFDGGKSELNELNQFMAAKLQEKMSCPEYDPNFVNCWSFLEGYYPETHEIDSQLIMNETLDVVEDFAKELTVACHNLSFYGKLTHGWLISEGPDTEIIFTHIARTNTLWWCGEQAMVWDCSTNKQRKWSKRQARDIYPAPVRDEAIAFPISIECRSKDPEAIARIEHLQIGDPVSLKSMPNSKDIWPLSIEVRDKNEEHIASMVPDTTNIIVQLADNLDILQASVDSVTPLSKRRKNAKYALFSVRFDIKRDGLSGEEQQRASALDAISQEEHKRKDGLSDQEISLLHFKELEANAEAKRKKERRIFESSLRDTEKGWMDIVYQQKLYFPQHASFELTWLKEGIDTEFSVGDYVDMRCYPSNSRPSLESWEIRNITRDQAWYEFPKTVQKIEDIYSNHRMLITLRSSKELEHLIKEAPLIDDGVFFKYHEGRFNCKVVDICKKSQQKAIITIEVFWRDDGQSL